MLEKIKGTAEVSGHYFETFGVAFLDILNFLAQWPKTTLSVAGFIIFYTWYMSRRRKYLTAKVRLKEEKIKTQDRTGFALFIAVLVALLLLGSYSLSKSGKKPKDLQEQGAGR